MRKAQQIWNLLADQTDLSDEPIPGQTIVEISGFHRVLIENHSGVDQYEPGCIVVRGKSGDIHVCGQDLEVSRISKESIVIKGYILQVSLERRC